MSAKISDLPASGPLSGAEVLEILQTGANKKESLLNIFNQIIASATQRGAAKLYNELVNSNTDGAPTQAATKTAIGSAFQDTTTLAIYKMTNFGTP